MNGPQPVAVAAAPEADFSEIAAALGVSLQATKKRAAKEGWPYREQAQRGGRKRLFAVAALPAAVREAVQKARLGHLTAVAVATPDVAVLASLTDRQRLERDARIGVLAALTRLQQQTGCSQEAAMTTLLVGARAGKLEASLDAMLRLARDPRGRKGDGYPSVRTLKRWLKADDLTPRINTRDMTVPPWAPAFLRHYQVPQKPSIASAYHAYVQATPGESHPSIHQVRRFLDKMGAVTREAGRRLPRDLKAIRPFVRRDTNQMWPGDCYTADGHTFDAEVAHPLHGKPFRPEITTVLDVATRYARGWSAGLAESTWAVLDALRHACETGGIPAIFYVDNGSGYKNAMMANEATGFMARLGITLTHSLPYNSQARGVIERAHQSIWVRGAKTLATYMGAGMDREAKQKVFKITRAEIKAAGASRLLMPWADFLTWCQEQIDAYNHRPHRALPKVRDPQTGKLRHQTPAEAWAAALEEGWQPVSIEPGEAVDLFRPYKECKVIRGEVRLFNNRYFSPALEEHHGETVRVGYDIHDAGRVWVRDSRGRQICVAEFEANRRSYFPQSFIEQAAQRRAEDRIARAQARIDEAEAELNPPALLEAAHSQVVTLMPARRDKDAVEAKPLAAERGGADCSVVPMPAPLPDRPVFETDAQKYRWLRRNPECLTTEDERWIGWYRTTSEWEDLFGEQEGFELAAR